MERVHLPQKAVPQHCQKHAPLMSVSHGQRAHKRSVPEGSAHNANTGVWTVAACPRLGMEVQEWKSPEFLKLQLCGPPSAQERGRVYHNGLAAKACGNGTIAHAVCQEMTPGLFSWPGN